MKTFRDNENYYEKEDKLAIKAGVHSNFKQILKAELESLGIIAFTDTTCPRPNAILFMRGTRGARHIWWSSAFISDEERDIAIENTIEVGKRFKEKGYSLSSLNWRACKPECMGDRGY
jgi:hypothetical protein